MSRFESLLLAPVTILGTPAEAGLNQKNSTSLPLGTQTAFNFHPPKDSGGFDAPLQQASLSPNAQWRSQKPFKPLIEFCNLFVGHTTSFYNHRRSTVSEIKSTMDIVLEKTKHLTLSEDEKRAQKKKEAYQYLSGLLQKYQDEVLDIDQLKDSLNELKEFYDSIDTHVLVSEILDRIELDKDNRLLMVVLDDICQVDLNGLKAVLSEYQKTLDMRRDQRSDHITEKLSRHYHVSGSAVLPNLAAEDEWAAELQTIYAEYNRLLSREKVAMLKGWNS
jgi:hypothetical protein